MAKIETVVKQVRHDFTKEELAGIAEEQSSILQEIDEVKAEGKSVASQYANKVKRLEADLKSKTNKHRSKFELRDALCHVRKNFETKEREYVSVQTGEIVFKEPFYPSDHKLRFDFVGTQLQTDMEKAKYLGMAFFYDKLYEFATAEEFIGQEMQDVIDQKSYAIISLCAGYLVNERKVLSIEDEVAFDAVFGMLEDWFKEFVDNGAVKPKEEDYPQFEEQTDEAKAKAQELEAAEEREQEDNPEKKIEKPKKARKKKNETDENGGETGSDDEPPTPWNHL